MLLKQGNGGWYRVNKQNFVLEHECSGCCAAEPVWEHSSVTTSKLQLMKLQQAVLWCSGNLTNWVFMEIHRQ